MSFFKVMFDKGHKKLRDKCKKCEKYLEVYEFAWPYLKYVFKYFTPVAIIIVFIFSGIYYFFPSNSSSFSNSSFFNCTTLSIEGFFTLIDFDKYKINGLFEFFPIVEYFIYSMLIATFITILLSKAIEDDKERKWDPIKNEAYKEIDTRIKNISCYVKELFGYHTLIFIGPGEINNEKIDEKINEKNDEDVTNFIKHTKSDNKDNIEVRKTVKNDAIKFKIKINDTTLEIKESRFKEGNLENRLQSMSSELSILQMKYQQYIEPKITNNIIKIQTNLNLAKDTISAYKILPGNKDNQCNCIQDIVFYLLKAAEFSQEVSEQSKEKITQEIKRRPG